MAWIRIRFAPFVIQLPRCRPEKTCPSARPLASVASLTDKVARIQMDTSDRILDETCIIIGRRAQGDSDSEPEPHL